MNRDQVTRALDTEERSIFAYCLTFRVLGPCRFLLRFRLYLLWFLGFPFTYVRNSPFQDAHANADANANADAHANADVMANASAILMFQCFGNLDV